MRQNMQNIHDLNPIIDASDEPKPIAGNIEHRAASHQICVWIDLPHLDQRPPTRLLEDLIPLLQARLSISVRLDKLQNRLSANHSQGTMFSYREHKSKQPSIFCNATDHRNLPHLNVLAKPMPSILMRCETLRRTIRMLLPTPAPLPVGLNPLDAWRWG